jgi:hypothetical protein
MPTLGFIHSFADTPSDGESRESGESRERNEFVNKKRFNCNAGKRLIDSLSK